MATVAVKRKRGRPRRDEPREINDFDVALVREFQQRPVLYDRNHMQHRNREYIEPQWADMARLLGYNVSLVKNRMLQLRNRFNLEKRRIEAVQPQFDNPEIVSQWPLYESLSFLGEHIKPRRQFGRQLKPEQPATSNSNSSDNHGFDETSQFNNEGGAADGPIHNSQQSQVALMPELNQSMPDPLQVANNPLNSNCGVDKFKAFGHFLASSLIEMNEKDALRLVEKFTSDVVRSLTMEQQKTLPISLNQQQHQTDLTASIDSSH